MKELEKVELMEVNGGKLAYLEYTWTETDNELIYAFEAAANGVKAVANGGIWIWNHTFG